jgi:acetyl/propionyl-CoA carboxylase alpha subunit
MQQALKDYRVVGPNNNLRFLKRVLDDPVFQGGEYDTSFIENNEASLLGKTQQV